MGNYFEKIMRGEQPYDVNDFYDKTTKIINMPQIDVPLHPKGVGFDLFECMQKHFGKIAQRDATTDESDTYDDLFKRSVRTAIKLKSLGLKPGDRVSLSSHNHIDCASTYFGTLFAGGTPASLDSMFSQEDTQYLLGLVEPRFVFVSPDALDNVATSVENLGIDTRVVVFGGDSGKHLKYEEFACEQKGEDEFCPYEVGSLEDVAVILFSSGSTGQPKGICLSHKFLTYHTSVLRAENYLLNPTLYWISANLTLISMMRFGGTRSFAQVFDPERIWQHILKYGIETMQLNPYEAMEMLLAKPENAKIPLKTISLGAYSPTVANFLKLRAGFPGVAVGDVFAMSETSLLFTGVDPLSYAKVKSVGIPLPNYQYKLVDPETEEVLGANQHGELRVKSNYIFSGYYKMDRSAGFDADGYFKTGDIAYRDDDFSFFIVDRIREMFKYRGTHITPVTLEKILCEHPDVDRAVVIGVPHEVDEHRIGAVVVPKKGTTITPEDVEAFYNGRVADERQLIRAGVKFFDEVPLTPTGKINRPAVRRMALAQFNI